MAVSPVVTHTVDRSRTAASPLKIIGASTQTSANGTPQPAPSAEAVANLPPTLDLAEQMNDEEKRKYVKGSNAWPLYHTHFIF
jgi:cyclin-dependent kinase 7